jgi:hypothetical protein
VFGNRPLRAATYSQIAALKLDEYPAMAKHPFQRLRTPTMTATRLKTESLAQDLAPARPVLSAANSSGGLLSGLLQAFKAGKGKAAEPRANLQRREPHFGPRDATGAAD